MNIISSFARFISAWFASMIQKKLTPQAKRVLLLGSLTAKLGNDRNINRSTLRKLNNVFALCKDEKALEMPVHLSNVIWKGDEGTEVFDLSMINASDSNNQEEVDARVRQILEKVPAYLRYGSEEEIESDIRQLIQHRSAILA